MTNFYLFQAQGITYRYATGNERNTLVEVQPVRRPEKDVHLDERIYNDAGETRGRPIAAVEFPEKIVLRYTLNANGNADLNFDAEGKSPDENAAPLQIPGTWDVLVDLGQCGDGDRCYEHGPLHTGG